MSEKPKVYGSPDKPAQLRPKPKAAAVDQREVGAKVRGRYGVEADSLKLNPSKPFKSKNRRVVA